jgi:hypothetical protein
MDVVSSFAALQVSSKTNLFLELKFIGDGVKQ